MQAWRVLAVSVALCGCETQGGGAGEGTDGTTNATTGSSTTADTSGSGEDTQTGPGTTSSASSGTTEIDSSSTGDDDPRGPLVVDDEYPAWFRYAGAGSHFLCGPGDPEDFLYRGTENADGTREGDQIELIAKLAPTGANGIYVQAVRSGGDGDATHNPFVDHDPNAGVNDAVLDQWQGWLEALDDAGVVTYLILYDDGVSPFGGGDEVTAAEQAFVETLVDRLEHLDLLVWVIGEEYSEALSTARASALAGIIANADDAGHPVGVHQLHGLDFDFATDPSVDQFTIQYNVDEPAVLHEGMVQAFASAAGAYNLSMSEAAMHGTGQQARLFNWASAMGGAYVMVLGMDIASTAIADLEDCGRLVDFFESTRFRETAPNDALAAGETDFVLAAEGEVYILYAADATTELGLQAVAGTYDLRWFDPLDADVVEQAGVMLTDGPNTLPLPDGIGPEVALSIESR